MYRISLIDPSYEAGYEKSVFTEAVLYSLSRLESIKFLNNSSWDIRLFSLPGYMDLRVESDELLQLVLFDVNFFGFLQEVSERNNLIPKTWKAKYYKANSGIQLREDYQGLVEYSDAVQLSYISVKNGFITNKLQ
jgi:hypothetical protein